MKKVGKGKSFVWIILILSLASPRCVFGQTEEKVVTVTGSKADPNQQKNPHIVEDMPDDDRTPALRSRGQSCTVKFANQTGLFIKLYVDGKFKGVLGPFSKQTVSVNSGYTTIYAISSGKTKEWGADGNCAGLYTYNLK